ncbi:hypothetical protein HDU85_002066 [Gaertneriomyces sp. JEL0708]|nr:hypothetical protein HDU85_002066 [Gaertneriomyces sp. JEL0708]
MDKLKNLVSGHGSSAGGSHGSADQGVDFAQAGGYLPKTGTAQGNMIDKGQAYMSGTSSGSTGATSHAGGGYQQYANQGVDAAQSGGYLPKTGTTHGNAIDKLQSFAGGSNTGQPGKTNTMGSGAPL